MKLIKTAPQTLILFKFFGTLVVFLSLLVISSSLLVRLVHAQVPQLRLPCDTAEPKLFHSLRPEQASPCGDANKAYYCSNNLIFIEDFDMVGKNDCVKNRTTRTFDCSPNWKVPEHKLYVDLDDSQFPIEGNTELVKNSTNGSDSLDDATKVNEYVSWYLSGVNGRAEYGIPTDDQIVNYSGPLKKLLPGAIQDAVRSNSIEKATKSIAFSDDGDVEGGPPVMVDEPETHNQVVVCANKAVPLLPSWLTNFFGIGAVGLGKMTPSACPEGTEYRLKDWDESSINTAVDGARPYIAKLLSGNLLSSVLSDVLVERWSKKTPPLPWKDATGKPFVSSNAYLKAYNEWRGDWCAMIPNPFGSSSTILGGSEFPLCLGIPGVTNNEYADLFQYVPLAINPDKKGAEAVMDVTIQPSNGTQIVNKSYDLPKSAPLYFAHTKETMDASNLLNTTYTPKDYESQPVPKSTGINDCSIVNVRTNPGDNLFPGDPGEIQVPGVTYFITKTTCQEVFTPGAPTGCGEKNRHKCADTDDLTCNAEVIITIFTNTKTPFADQIFSSTVADSASTFRKIYPEVDENAPVTCVADIPTITGVEYDHTKSEIPEGGTQEFKVKDIPGDGGGEGHHLAFPHIGSVYEYFLKGIQTALRPKGYADPNPISGQNCDNISCGELPKLPTASGSCNLGNSSLNTPKSLDAIISAAAQTYKVPPSLILGIMYGEGLFEKGRFNWTDNNVKNWATCQKVPGCNESGDDNFMGFNGNDFETIAPHIQADILKLDPTRKKLSQCNLLDAIYAEAWNLHDSADGGGGMPNMCFGITLGGKIPTSCSWDEHQYGAAIQVSENGYQPGCFTLENSCFTGGGSDAICSGGGDNCETKDHRYPDPSHFACIWDIATDGSSGNKR